MRSKRISIALERCVTMLVGGLSVPARPVGIATPGRLTLGLARRLEIGRLGIGRLGIGGREVSPVRDEVYAKERSVGRPVGIEIPPRTAEIDERSSALVRVGKAGNVAVGT